jgi:N-acetylglucosamine kinase-like BadF-type ATPase
VAKVYVQPPPREAIAALAPFVLDAARGGDTVAMEIIAGAGAALGGLAVATLRQLGMATNATIPVITDGGFLRAGADLLLPPLGATVERAGWQITQRTATEEAAHGALRMAREML